MAQKCVHKGCGKTFADPSDPPCVYHPGPPVFHEGQKGWKCCKPRVLTFDEFMDIPPCATGQHSAVDDTPAPEPKPDEGELEAKIIAQSELKNSLPPPVARAPLAAQPPRASPSPAPPEDENEEDDPAIPIPGRASCKRRGCGSTYQAGSSREGEQCVHHPGHPLFHEGSKGWTCCKRKVLEFDEFLKIAGCKTRSRHLFIGKKREQDAATAAEEEVKEVRNDFYQTATTVIASLYLKKVDKASSTVDFREDGRAVELDLHTTDKKRYKSSMELFASIDAAKSSFKIMGTKLELTLVKAEEVGWPVLRAGDRLTGRAGRA